MIMSKQRIVDNRSRDKNNKSNDSQENTPVTITTKLERRRRIEDLNEEKRLREELSAF